MTATTAALAMEIHRHRRTSAAVRTLYRTSRYTP